MKDKNHKLILILLISCCCFFQNNFSQATQKKDTLYFDAKWEPTTKENHQFYRPLPLKTIDSLSFIIDYHKNGNMQMQAYAYTHDLNILVGDAYWYHNNGVDEKYEPYLNLTNKPLEYYHNNKTPWKTITYKGGVKHGKIKLFNKKGFVVTSETFKDGLILSDTVGNYNRRYYSARNNKAKKFNKSIPAIKNSTKVLYWENTRNIAKIINYKNKTYRDFRIIEDRTYSKNGELIHHYYKSDFLYNKLINGEYYNTKTKNGFVVAFDTIRASSQINRNIKIDKINYIGIHENHGGISFLSKKGLNTYSKLDYKFLYNNRSTPKKSFRIIDDTTNPKFTYEKLHDDFDKLIEVNNIKTQSVKELFNTIENKTWEINSSDGGNKKKLVFKLFNKDLFTFSELEFKKEYPGGFDSSLQQDNDAVKKWRLNEVKFHEINIILINDNKPILILNQHCCGKKYYIIPTINNGLIVKFDNNKNTVEKKVPNLNETVLKEIINYSYATLFYDVKTKKQKKYLTNNFDEILIDKPYDSIQPLKQYIIGRHKEGIDLYNSKLDKLPITNIRQAYYDRENLQILTNNEVLYIDALGKEVDRQNITTYGFCGTGRISRTFSLKESKERALNMIEIYSGRFRKDNNLKKILFLENLDIKHEITFLINNNKSFLDYSFGTFTDPLINKTNLLVVKKGEKTGLYSYNYNDVKFKNEKDIINIKASKYGSTFAKELLPIIYDEVRYKFPLIILKKDNKLGIYPLKNGLKYKNFGEVNNNFMSYETLNGEKGWIDVNTHQEFLKK